MIDNTAKTEPAKPGKVLKIAAILLYITTGLGLLFLSILSTVYLCFAIRKCRIDWSLPCEYDDVQGSIQDIDTEMMNQNESQIHLQSQTRG